eukprot:2378821-Rhodomonas_salina.4
MIIYIFTKVGRLREGGWLCKLRAVDAAQVVRVRAAVGAPAAPLRALLLQVGRRLPDLLEEHEREHRVRPEARVVREPPLAEPPHSLRLPDLLPAVPDA